MRQKKWMIFVLTLLLLAGFVLPVGAAQKYTVTFYKDLAKSEVHTVQQVDLGGHPSVPSVQPSAYEANGYRYTFKEWNWYIDDALFPFQFSGEDYEIWGATELFATYDQYLAEGYELIVIHNSGTEFLEDTTTPVAQILKQYSGVTRVYTQSKQDYTQGSGSDTIASAVVNGAAAEFTTLSLAVAAADSGSTVTLLADAAVDSALSINKALTLDLAGCAVSGEGITVNAAVTVDGTEFGSELSNAVTVGSGGTLTLNDGDYTAMTLNVESGGIVIVTAGSFSFDPSAYVDPTAYDITEDEGTYSVCPHNHSYDFQNPGWSWEEKAGSMTAEASYPCTCGERIVEQIDPSFVDSRGVRTYTATDNYGNTSENAVTLSYTVTLNGTAQESTYHWGDVCTLREETQKAWYVNSISEGNKVADGVASYTFPVTGDTVIVTDTASAQEQVAVVSANMTSPVSGQASFHAKWSLPSDAQVSTVKIYRGCTSTDKIISADTLVTKGSVFDVNLRVRNGDYLFRLTNLTPTKYQHAVIEIKYSVNGVEHTLLSSVQKVLPNGSH